MSAITPIPFYSLTTAAGRKLDVNLALVVSVWRRAEDTLEIRLANGVIVPICGDEVKRFLTALELARQGVFKS